MGQITTEQSMMIAKMADSNNMEMLEYLTTYSPLFLGKMVKKHVDLTSDEADLWIERYSKAA